MSRNAIRWPTEQLVGWSAGSWRPNLGPGCWLIGVRSPWQMANPFTCWSASATRSLLTVLWALLALAQQASTAMCMLPNSTAVCTTCLTLQHTRREPCATSQTATSCPAPARSCPVSPCWRSCEPAGLLMTRCVMLLPHPFHVACPCPGLAAAGSSRAGRAGPCPRWGLAGPGRQAGLCIFTRGGGTPCDSHVLHSDVFTVTP